MLSIIETVGSRAVEFIPTFVSTSPSFETSFYITHQQFIYETLIQTKWHSIGNDHLANLEIFVEIEYLSTSYNYIYIINKKESPKIAISSQF